MKRYYAYSGIYCVMSAVVLGRKRGERERGDFLTDNKKPEGITANFA